MSLPPASPLASHMAELGPASADDLVERRLTPLPPDARPASPAEAVAMITRRPDYLEADARAAHVAETGDLPPHERQQFRLMQEQKMMRERAAMKDAARRAGRDLTPGELADLDETEVADPGAFIAAAVAASRANTQHAPQPINRRPQQAQQAQPQAQRRKAPQEPPQPAPMTTASQKPAKSAFAAAMTQEPLKDAGYLRYVKKRDYAAPAKNAIQLPSLFLPYSWKSLSIQPLTALDDAVVIARVKAMAREAAETNNLVLSQEAYSTFLNVIGSKLPPEIDVRELTIPDFRWVLRNLQRLSYYKTGYSMIWTSSYGNEYRLNPNHIPILVKDIEITQAEYDEFIEEGFAIPRVADEEIFTGVELTPEDQYIWSKAQFFAGDTPMEKVAHFKAQSDVNGAALLARLEEFIAKIEHGELRTFKMRDPNFNALAFIETLKDEHDKQADILEQTLADMKAVGVTPDGEGIVIAQRRLLSEYQKQISDMEERLAQGEVIEADEEDVSLPEVSVFDLFPISV